MILTCEKCTTSYSVADDAIGEEGRKVKCIGCGHVWLQMAVPDQPPSEDAEFGAALTRPEGPIHFAGEHISGARGWMNGALESGLRAAREIHSG